MPVHKVKGGYKWGSHGHVYKSKAKAAAQGRAAYANGYRGDALPKGAHPLAASRAAEAEYVQALRGIARGVAEGTARAMARHLRVPESHGRVTRADALGRLAPHTETISLLGLQVQTHMKEEVGKAFDKMADAVDERNRAGVRQVIGIGRHDPSTEAMRDQFRDQNIRLMQKAGADYVDKVRAIMEAPENEGIRVEALANKLRAAATEMGDKGDALASRAELIARDQTLKLNSQMTKLRMTSNGITRYTWSTSNDERVRDSHAAVEGEEFGWDNPPPVGSRGEKCNPGEDIQCRCVPLPVQTDFDAL